jgi:hypothetical protein
MPRQVPVFVTAMMAIRRMSNSSWPGFEGGGALWFSDLTLPALDLGALVAPMGPAGSVLPSALALTMLLNLQLSFGSAHPASAHLFLRTAPGAPHLVVGVAVLGCGWVWHAVI